MMESDLGWRLSNNARNEALRGRVRPLRMTRYYLYNAVCELIPER
jgi:hypothetical protein